MLVKFVNKTHEIHDNLNPTKISTHIVRILSPDTACDSLVVHNLDEMQTLQSLHTYTSNFNKIKNLTGLIIVS